MDTSLDASLNSYFNLQQRTATLPGLGVEVDLPKGVLFRYDGEVDSIPNNLAKTDLIIKGKIREGHGEIAKLLNWPIDAMLIKQVADIWREKRPEVDELAGYCNGHKIDDDILAYVIAKKKGLPLSKSIFADGHESGEFLTHIQKRELLQELLDREGIQLNALAYEGEDFADIAGLLALKKARDTMPDGSKLELPVFRTRNQVLEELAKCFGL